MLIENQIHADRLAISIAGIGININQLNFPFSSATSLLAETGRTWNLYECLYDLIHHLDYRYGMLREEKLEALRSDYLGRLYGLGSELTFGKELKAFRELFWGLMNMGGWRCVPRGVYACTRLKKLLFSGRSNNTGTSCTAKIYFGHILSFPKQYCPYF